METRPHLIRAYDDGKVSWDGQVDERNTIFVSVRGHGTMAGARAMVAFLNEAMTRLEGTGATFHFDVSEVKSRPLRGQLVFSKWFMANRRAVRRGVIVGGGAFERRFVNTISKVAGFSHIRFFADNEDAASWLSAELETTAEETS